MKKARLTRTLMAAVSIVALSAVMYGCVHNGDGDDSTSTDMDSTSTDMTDMQPTPYETAKAAIAEAETAAAAQKAYDDVKGDVTAEQGEMLQMAVDSRIEAINKAARIEDQKMALADAADAIDTSDLSTADAIADATADINALQAAIDAAADVDDTSMYESQVMTARMAVATAQGNLDTQGRMATQRMAISNAVTMARTAVAGVDDDSTDSEVSAADSAIAALQAAIDGAADLPEGDADVASAQGTLDTLKGTLMAAKTSRTAAIDAANTAAAKAMAKLGKNLRAALGGPQAGGNALANIDLAASDTDLSDGLSIDAVTGAGSLADATNPDSEVLEPGASVGALGGWMGMDYAHSEGTGDAMVSNDARVYTNQGPDGTQPFSAAQTGGKYTLVATGDPLAGYLLLTAAGGTAPPSRARAAAFTHQGTQDHPIPDNSVALIFSGTYDGAPGQFRCTGECSSTNDGKDGPSVLGGTWHFKPNAGAMVRQPDANYLYYGWWVSKDADGVPTAASAFTGVNGTIAALASDPVSAVTGSATYSGNAAGKFAMSNPLDGTGSGGHFTADAELTATFGTNDAPNNGGVTGTIDNFRLNDGSDDPGWSVALHRAPWGSNGAFTSASIANDGIANGTTWSIDSNPALESGAWTGQMYDELPGNADDTVPGDGSNIPTTVTGTFYSEFSSIGRMVGAFGADKQ